MCRVQALRALCEIRLEKDDIVSLVEDAIKPCKASPECAPNAQLHTGCLQGAGVEGAV